MTVFLPSDTPLWHQLAQHASTLKHTALVERITHSGAEHQYTLPGMHVDVRANHWSAKTLDLLLAYAQQQKMEEAIERLFSGAHVNSTEDQPALHPLLRDTGGYFNVAGIDRQAVFSAHQKMIDWVATVRDQQWRGGSGLPIRSVVNIGIGGSDLGPRMVQQALEPYQNIDMDFYFVANLDDSEIHSVLKKLDPKTTLFIVASKSFTTEETLSNANIARHWFQKNTGGMDDKRHFIAVTAHPDRAQEKGYPTECILPFWHWVGGRYSVWSAVGVSIALAIGVEAFTDFLQGAHTVDQHFFNTPLSHNIPVLLALLAHWYTNFMGYSTRAVIPYSHYLRSFPDYLQQLSMESLGKRVTHEGLPVNYITGEIIWGAVGTNAQHSFYQFLLQGTHKVATDFILPLKMSTTQERSLPVIAHCLAQGRVFAEGASTDSEHRLIPGGCPFNRIMLNVLDPKTIGALIALYEHKVYAQSVLLNINAFDQWGVEQGKRLAGEIIRTLKNDAGDYLPSETLLVES